jgi:dTMP kinase
VFVAIEGPNGVGKTTVATLLAKRWQAQAGELVHLTTEPSATALGTWLRQAEAWTSGRALALLLAADRYIHVDEEIIPALDAGAHVVTDRYVQSSLVLQRVDSVDLDEIWTYNRYVLQPALSIYLDEAPATLAKRLDQRGRLSRLEASGTPEQEVALYADARRFLDRKCWRQRVVDCRGHDPDDIVDDILHHIAEVPS